MPAIIAAFTKRKDFKIPGLVMGFKVADHDKATKVVGKLRQLQGRAPGKFETRKVGGQDFVAYVLSGKDIPISKEQFIKELGEAQVSQYQAETLHEWLSERTIEVAIGRSGDYLVVSFGSDSTHLERLGSSNSLGKSDVLSPIRKHLGNGNVLSIGYASLAIASIGQTSMKQSLGQIEPMVAPFKGFLPPGLADRILGDLHELASDVDSVATKPSETVSVSLYNRGPESFSYSKTEMPGVDFSRPLAILHHAGDRPMLAVAGSSKSSMSAYKSGVKYAKKLWGYWRDYGIPKLEDEQKEKYKKAESAILPFLAKVDAALANKLLPATDAGQSLFAIDTKMRVGSLGPDVQFPKPMPMIELAIGATLNDSKLFKEAIVDIANAVEEVVPKLAALEPNAPEEAKNFKIPRPNVKSVGGGDMYYYPLPPIVDKAILPHAYVGDKLFILGMSPAMTERMVKEAKLPAGEVIDFEKPAGVAVAMDMEGFWKGIREWVTFVAAQPNSPIGAKDANGVMARQHLEAGLEVLGVFKKAVARTYREGGYTVSHGWAHFQDLPN